MRVVQYALGLRMQRLLGAVDRFNAGFNLPLARSSGSTPVPHALTAWPGLTVHGDDVTMEPARPVFHQAFAECRFRAILDNVHALIATETQISRSRHASPSTVRLFSLAAFTPWLRQEYGAPLHSTGAGVAYRPKCALIHRMGRGPIRASEQRLCCNSLGYDAGPRVGKETRTTGRCILAHILW